MLIRNLLIELVTLVIAFWILNCYRFHWAEIKTSVQLSQKKKKKKAKFEERDFDLWDFIDCFNFQSWSEK